MDILNVRITHLRSIVVTPIKKFILLLSPILAVACGDSSFTTCAPRESSVTYEVTFNGVWSADTHPTSFPPGPHFSGLIGTTHNSDFTMWDEGAMASPGMESMAEMGSKDPLNSEIDTAIAQRTAGIKISGDGINPSPGSVSLVFTITRPFPLVSLVSMIAPSPDWFVGISGVPLCERNEWVSMKQISIFGYDAGTDHGAFYTAQDQEEDPHLPIRPILTDPIAPNGNLVPLGTFTFARK
jgi:hypothetical protein